MGQNLNHYVVMRDEKKETQMNSQIKWNNFNYNKDQLQRNEILILWKVTQRW